MRKVIKNNYKFILGILVGLIISIATVYAVDAYIESSKISYDNHNEKITKKNNVQDSIDELYERSGIHKEKWVDKALNGADPVLKEPLIPVEITDNGDAYYANLNSEWYNYSEKRWANAVILVDEPTKEYTVGAKIEEDDIESYFVWIPRYQYKIWDMGNYKDVYTFSQLTDLNVASQADTSFWKLAGSNAKLIDIKFGDVNDIPKMTEPTTTDLYYTHPAFTLGDKDLNGIWVGKFETGGSANNIIIKPNVTSLRNETVKVFFDAGKDYSIELDSHMMKNTEWGAVAYLSHSKYGIGNEVNINNNSEYKTGYSATTSTDQRTSQGTQGKTDETNNTQPWDSLEGHLASTTGNISGVYDMSGGSWEYMAACVEGVPFNSNFSQDELSTQISDGYINGYSSNSTLTSYDKRILGDATSEMGPLYNYYEGDGNNYLHNSWYGDYADFVDSTAPWFIRGSAFYTGILAGQFAFSRYTGVGDNNIGFRMVLSPTE